MPFKFWPTIIRFWFFLSYLITTVCINSHHKENLNFLFLSLCVYLFKKCPSQFLSHWQSAETVFCSKEFIFLPYKNQSKSVIFSSGQENSNFSVLWELYISVPSIRPHLLDDQFWHAVFWSIAGHLKSVNRAKWPKL